MKSKLFFALNTICILVMLSTVTLQLIYLNPFVSTWDQVDFALALQRFDLMQMQPHFPGYPYFILGGMIMKLVSGKMNESLVLFNVIFYFSSIYPISRLAAYFTGKKFYLLVSAIVYTTTYATVMVNQPISEGAAIAAMWWFVWSIHVALIAEKKAKLWIPLFWLSILMGIRLSYLPFASGVLFVFYQKWKKKLLTFKEIGMYLCVAVLFQFVWLAGLILTEGSLKGFVKLSLAFTSGHFQDWGGAVGASNLSVWDRLYYLVALNIVWTGVSAENILLLILYGVLLSIIAFDWFKNRNMFDRRYIAILIMSFSYFVWALFAQNIEKPRHALPIILLFIFWLSTKWVFKRNQTLVILVSILILCVQLYTSFQLVKQQATDRPAIYEMAEYIENQSGPCVLYTWEETRVLQYLNVPFYHKRVQTYEIFKQDAKNYHDREIYLTNKVVEGFKRQGIDMKGIIKLAEFQSNPIFDPVYNEVTLYKWRGESSE